MFRRLFTTLTVGFLFFFSVPSLVSAHTLKSDGPIGAIIHIDPGDDPIIGEEANFYFEFKDKEGRFKIDDCICLVTVSKDSEDLTSQNLNLADLETASFSFVFPEKGVYKIKLSGTPRNDSTFQPFDLEYTQRVDRTSKASTTNLNFPTHFLVLGGIATVFLLVFFFNSFVNKEKKQVKTPPVSKFQIFLVFFVLLFLSHEASLNSLLVNNHHQTDSNHEPCCLLYSIDRTPEPKLNTELHFSSENLVEITQEIPSYKDIVANTRSPPLNQA